MLLTRKKLRLLLYEMLLLERISKQELIGKIRYLDAYNSYLDKLNPKYYDALDRLISEYDAEGNADVAHGVIIFMLTMHQKYASTTVLPPEHKDFNQMNLETLKGAIEGIGAQYTDGAMYGEMVELDKKQSEQKEKDDKEEASGDEKPTTNTNINREVRPGLFLLGIVDGWQIHKPTTVAGSQAFGVGSWCTVYSDAFSTYKSSGITLYYLCKDGKDYDEKGYGFDYKENPYDYVCIGFEEDRLAIPSDDYTTSVWGNQVGVTYDRLKKVMGTSSDKIINLITKHFNGEYASSKTGNPQEYLKRKLMATAATVPRALKTIARNKGPDDTYKLILDCLNHPKLNTATMEYIFKKFYLKIDSKMQKTEAYTSGSYKRDLLMSFLSIHTTPSDLIKNDLAFDFLENYKELFRKSLNNESLKNSSLWSQELNVEVYEKFFDLLEINKIQTFDKPAGDWDPIVDTHLFDMFIDIISTSEVVSSGKNIASAVRMLEDKYNLGVLDEIVNVYINFGKSYESPNKVETFNTRVGFFMQILQSMEVSPHVSDKFKHDMLRQKIDYGLRKASDKEIEYAGNTYKVSGEVPLDDLKKVTELGDIAQRLHRIFSHGSVQGAHRSRVIIDNTLADKRETPSKVELVKLLKAYVSTHNKFCQLVKDLDLYFDVRSDIYGPIAHNAAKLSPEEMRSLLNDLGGITRNGNDFYFVGKLVDATSQKSSTIEHKVEAFDLVQDMLNKYSKQGPIDNNDKNVKYRLSRLVYGGYNGGTKENNAKLCYGLLKQQPEIFFTCVEYFYRYADSYDRSHLRNEWEKILNSLVSKGDITYEQALADVKYINEKFYERSTKFADNEYQLKDFQRGILYPQRIVNPNEGAEDDEDDF